MPFCPYVSHRISRPANRRYGKPREAIASGAEVNAYTRISGLGFPFLVVPSVVVGVVVSPLGDLFVAALGLRPIDLDATGCRTGIG